MQNPKSCQGFFTFPRKGRERTTSIPVTHFIFHLIVFHFPLSCDGILSFCHVESTYTHACPFFKVGKSFSHSFTPTGTTHFYHTRLKPNTYFIILIFHILHNNQLATPQVDSLLMRNKLFTILAIKALLYSLVFANPLDRLAIRAQIQKRWVLTETQLSYIATVTQTIPSGASNVGGISILQTVTIGNSAASAVTPDIIAPGLSNKQAVNVDSNNGNNNGDNNANNNGINNGNTAGQVTTANANNNNGNQAATPVPVPVASTVPAGPSSTAAANNNDNSNGDGDIVGNLNVKHAAANVQQGDAQTTPWPTAIGDGSNLISATFPVSSWPATASFTSLVLMHHNKHRQNSSVPSLSWNDEMANIAYTWASQCDYHHNT